MGEAPRALRRLDGIIFGIQHHCDHVSIRRRHRIIHQRAGSGSHPLLLFALGMAVYNEIVGPGCFAQLGQWPMVVMFLVVLAGAVWGAAGLIKEDMHAAGT